MDMFRHYELVVDAMMFVNFINKMDIGQEI